MLQMIGFEEQKAVNAPKGRPDSRGVAAEESVLHSKHCLAVSIQ
jgi:hypothetical protein